MIAEGGLVELALEDFEDTVVLVALLQYRVPFEQAGGQAVRVVALGIQQLRPE